MITNPYTFHIKIAYPLFNQLLDQFYVIWKHRCKSLSKTTFKLGKVTKAITNISYILTCN